MSPVTTPKKIASGVMPKRTTPKTASPRPRRFPFRVRNNPNTENPNPNNQNHTIRMLPESISASANTPNANPVMEAQSWGASPSFGDVIREKGR